MGAIASLADKQRMRTRSSIFAAALAVVLHANPGAAAQVLRESGADDAPDGGGEFRRLTRKLDFDERKRGNFEKLPVNWGRIEGPGLLAFLEGRIDDEIGHDAAPSFRLDLQTGNLGYEYRKLDLTVVPESDYLLVGYVRAVGLKHARAFMSAGFVDRFGEPLAGSDAVSNLIRSSGEADEPWQRIELKLRGDFPAAHALRLQIWILQSSVWRDQHAVDPIEETDVRASAWFDDLAIYRAPRARLLLSAPGGLIHLGEPASVVVEMTRALAESLAAELTVFDVNGDALATRDIALENAAPPSAGEGEPGTPGVHREVGDDLDATTASHCQLPELPAGTYRLRLRLRSGDETVVERWARIAVARRLREETRTYPDVAADLPRWSAGASDGLIALLRGLRCGTARVGVPLVGPLDGPAKIDYFREFSVFLRDLAAARIESAGIFQVPGGAAGTRIEPTRLLLDEPQRWQNEVNPVLSSLGGALTTWQLGDEGIELDGGAAWSAVELEQVRRQLRRFSSVPRLIVPQSVTGLAPPTGDPVTILLPREIPTRHIPTALREAAELAQERWLRVDFEERGGRDFDDWQTDLARRFILAKAANLEHLAFAAPLEAGPEGGGRGWQPTEAYLPLRTLTAFLGGKRAIAAMEPAPGVTAIIFEGAARNCIALWAWDAEAAGALVELYLGDSAVAYDLLGASQRLPVKAGRTQIQPKLAPVFIEATSAPLALLQASYSVAPRHVEGEHADPPPLLTFANPYPSVMTGEVLITPPPSWQIEPLRIPFELAPGAALQSPLDVRLPPRQIAAQHPLGVRITVHSPQNDVLEFREKFQVGLKDIALDSKARWRGDELVIELTLRNLSKSPVSFTAFCAPPGKPRSEGVFLDVTAGESATLGFAFSNARALAGGAAYVGIQEIRGDRTLNQLVDLPQ